MVRKEFINKMSLALGGVLANPLRSRADEALAVKASLRLKKGLGYGMINEDIPLLDKFKMVKDLGFDGIEFDSPIALDLHQLLEARDQTGLEIPSVVNKDHWSKPLSHPDAEVRAFTIKSVGQSLQDVKALGGDTVLVVPGVVNAQVSYEQAFNNALDSVRKLIPHVEKTEVKIGLENVWNNFILSPLEAKHFVDTINHPLIGWYFDIGNILRYGWPEHWIETLNRRIVKLHIKEFSREKMNNEGLGKGFDVELTEGDIDWAVVMQSIRTVDYQGQWITAEVKAGDRNHLAKISQQMDRILNS